MLIRKYTDEDFKQIFIIDQLSHEWPTPELLLMSQAEKGQTWVAEDNGTIVGFLIGKIKHELPYIYDVAVMYTHRKQGIATKLFEVFEKTFGEFQKPENSLFWLQVEANNPAQKLYFDLGYRVTLVDENMYGNGRHGLCMYKSARPVSDL